MPITTLTRAQYLQNWINQYAAELKIVPNLPEGDIALAFGEADSQQAEVLQYMAILVINFARAATCEGADLDSWMAQFGFTRLPAKNGTGTATFSIASPTTQLVYIPINTVIQTPGGAIQYKVIANNSMPTYDPSRQAYYIPIGDSSTNVTIQSVTAGAGYNVQSGQLIQLVSNVFGITAVTNPLAIQDGANAETDASFRARFVDFINGLSKATETAIFFAITSIQTGLKVALYENVFFVGDPPTSVINPKLGNIAAIIDDGSGAPSAALLAAALAAMANTRAFGIRYQVLGPAVVSPSIELDVVLKTGAISATVTARITAAIVAFVNALQIGDTIYLSDIIDIANSDVDVVSVQPNSWKIDNLIADFVLEPFQEALIALTDVAVGVV